MKIAIASHGESYTSKFAVDYYNRWQQIFGDKIEIIDMAKMVVGPGYDISIMAAKKNNFEIEGRPIRILYAFHPQASYNSSEDIYVERSNRTSYYNLLYSSDCQNLPIQGMWGQHLSIMFSMRLMSSANLQKVRLKKIKTGEKYHNYFIDPTNCTNVGHFVVTSGVNHNYYDCYTIDGDLEKYKNNLAIVHLLYNQVLIYNPDGELLSSGKMTAGHQKLVKLTGSKMLQLLAFTCKNGEIEYLGICPLFTIFPELTLKIIQHKVKVKS